METARREEDPAGRCGLRCQASHNDAALARLDVMVVPGAARAVITHIALTRWTKLRTEDARGQPALDSAVCVACPSGEAAGGIAHRHCPLPSIEQSTADRFGRPVRPTTREALHARLGSLALEPLLALLGDELHLVPHGQLLRLLLSNSYMPFNRLSTCGSIAPCA